MSLFKRKRPGKAYADMELEELLKLDLQMRREGYEIEGRLQEAFARYVQPIRLERRAARRERDKVAAAIELARRSPTERAAIAAALEDGPDG